MRASIGSFRSHTKFPTIGGVAPASIPGIDWSDHWAFEQAGFPAIMITDTAPFRYPYYHTAFDLPDCYRALESKKLRLVDRGVVPA